MKKTIPAMANSFPWNEYILQRGLPGKTISFNWKYRGPCLLYTSWSVDVVADDARLDPDEWPRGAIIGMAQVVNVKTERETGNWPLVIFKKPYRFRKPIPFKPKRGAVRIHRVPLSLLKRHLTKREFAGLVRGLEE